jgi:hypothetical protein
LNGVRRRRAILYTTSRWPLLTCRRNAARLCSLQYDDYTRKCYPPVAPQFLLLEIKKYGHTRRRIHRSVSVPLKQIETRQYISNSNTKSILQQEQAVGKEEELDLRSKFWRKSSANFPTPALYSGVVEVDLEVAEGDLEVIRGQSV